MVKIKYLRIMAHAARLKLAESAWSEANRLACEIVKIAIDQAKKDKAPKLEGKHFSGIAIFIKKENNNHENRMDKITKR